MLQGGPFGTVIILFPLLCALIDVLCIISNLKESMDEGWCGCPLLLVSIRSPVIFIIVRRREVMKNESQDNMVKLSRPHTLLSCTMLEELALV